MKRPSPSPSASALRRSCSSSRNAHRQRQSAVPNVSCSSRRYQRARRSKFACRLIAPGRELASVEPNQPRSAAQAETNDRAIDRARRSGRRSARQRATTPEIRAGIRRANTSSAAAGETSPRPEPNPVSVQPAAANWPLRTPAGLPAVDSAAVEPRCSPAKNASDHEHRRIDPIVANETSCPCPMRVSAGSAHPAVNNTPTASSRRADAPPDPSGQPIRPMYS